MSQDDSQNIARLNAESIEAKRRLDILEENNRRHESDIRELHSNQAGTKIYVTQIFDELKEIKSQLFAALQNAQSGGQKERKDWQDLFRDVLKMTLGAVVAYLFTRGG